MPVRVGEFRPPGREKRIRQACIRTSGNPSPPGLAGLGAAPAASFRRSLPRSRAHAAAEATVFESCRTSNRHSKRESPPRCALDLGKAARSSRSPTYVRPRRAPGQVIGELVDGRAHRRQTAGPDLARAPAPPVEHASPARWRARRSAIANVRRAHLRTRSGRLTSSSRRAVSGPSRATAYELCCLLSLALCRVPCEHGSASRGPSNESCSAFLERTRPACTPPPRPSSSPPSVTGAIRASAQGRGL